MTGIRKISCKLAKTMHDLILYAFLYSSDDSEFTSKSGPHLHAFYN